MRAVSNVVSAHRLPICILLAGALWLTSTTRPLCALKTVRVVPQLGWPAEGRVAPNGAWYAGLGGASVRLVDAQQSRLAGRSRFGSRTTRRFPSMDTDWQPAAPKGACSSISAPASYATSPSSADC